MKLTAPLDIVPRQREHGTVAPHTHTYVVIACIGRTLPLQFCWHGGKYVQVVKI
jgi:hypothetical protein